MSEENLPGQETRHAFPVAWGWFAQHIGLIQAIYNFLCARRGTGTARTLKSWNSRWLSWAACLIFRASAERLTLSTGRPLRRPGSDPSGGLLRCQTALSTLSMEEVRDAMRAVEQVEQHLIDAELDRLRGEGSASSMTAT